MDNSLQKKNYRKRRADAPRKIKIKPFLIGKELKTKDLLKTAADRASGSTTKPNPKPESKPRIAAAERRVTPVVLSDGHERISHAASTRRVGSDR